MNVKNFSYPNIFNNLPYIYNNINQVREHYPKTYIKFLDFLKQNYVVMDFFKNRELYKTKYTKFINNFGITFEVEGGNNITIIRYDDLEIHVMDSMYLDNLFNSIFSISFIIIESELNKTPFHEYYDKYILKKT